MLKLKTHKGLSLLKTVLSPQLDVQENFRQSLLRIAIKYLVRKILKIKRESFTQKDTKHQESKVAG
jgi:hypothetical protein